MHTGKAEALQICHCQNTDIEQNNFATGIDMSSGLNVIQRNQPINKANFK